MTPAFVAPDWILVDARHQSTGWSNSLSGIPIWKTTPPWWAVTLIPSRRRGPSRRERAGYPASQPATDTPSRMRKPMRTLPRSRNRSGTDRYARQWRNAPRSPRGGQLCELRCAESRRLLVIPVLRQRIRPDFRKPQQLIDFLSKKNFPKSSVQNFTHFQRAGAAESRSPQCRPTIRPLSSGGISKGRER